LLSVHRGAQGGPGLVGMRHVNLSGNQLTGQGVLGLIKTIAVENCLTLDLSSNRLREEGCLAVVKLVGMCRNLLELNLSGNPLGDQVLEDLCESLTRECPSLEGLGLAKCSIGQTHRGGVALGKFLANSSKARSLDLHWNMLHGVGAHGFFRGLKENCEGVGTLRLLNVAWNRLGSGVQADSARKKDATQSARLLSSIFREGQSLLHLDLSYNNINAEDCMILAQALRDNHTLFGIHLIGNEAAVDDLGFVVPLRRSPFEPSGPCLPGAAANTAAAESQQSASKSFTKLKTQMLQSFEDGRQQLNITMNGVPDKLRLTHPIDFSTFGDANFAADAMRTMRHNPSLNSLGAGKQFTSFSEDDIQTERSFVQANSRIQPIAGMATSMPESVQRNVQCCWICENWVEYRVVYTPGISGDVIEVETACVLFGLDGFMRPTRLVRVEERAGRTRGTNQHTRHPQGKNLEKVVRWSGVRMLPPSMEPIELVFVINGQCTIANDYQTRSLAVSKTVALQSEYADLVGVVPKPMDIDVVNVVQPGQTAWEKFSLGMATALCVIEDPVKSGSISVMPRQVWADSTKVKETSTLEVLVFKDDIRYRSDLSDKCFEKDWEDSRLSQIIRSDDARHAISQKMRPHYMAITTAFACSAFADFEMDNAPAGVKLSSFKELVVQYGGEGKGTLFDDSVLKVSDVDYVFVAASVIDRSKRSEFSVFPGRALARFQFLEAIVRLALRRGQVQRSTHREAIDEFMKLTRLGDDKLALRRSVEGMVSNEACQMVYRDNMETLVSVFEAYKSLMCYPGRQMGVRHISYLAWMLFMRNSGIVAPDDFPQKDVGVPFALGRQMHVDETSGWRHMELSFSEFLVSLAFVVRLRPGYVAEFFHDQLDEFLATNLEDALNAVHTSKSNRSARATFRKAPSMAQPGTGIDIDVTVIPSVNFMRKLMGHSPTGQDCVDTCELRRLFQDKAMRMEAKRVKLTAAEVDLILHIASPGAKGMATQTDVLQVLIQVKTCFKGMERVIVCLEDSFDQFCAAQGGAVVSEEFFAQEGFVARLISLGLHAADAEELQTTLASGDENRWVSLVDIMEGLMNLLDPENASLRGVRALEERFNAAKHIGSDGLSKEEVLTTFTKPELVAKLNRLELQEPDWAVLFEELDMDMSGDLSWDEIRDGMTAFWGTASSPTNYQ